MTKPRRVVREAQATKERLAIEYWRMLRLVEELAWAQWNGIWARSDALELRLNRKATQVAELTALLLLEEEAAAATPPAEPQDWPILPMPNGEVLRNGA